METETFIDRNSSLETYWRSIILLGRNVASYKFALAKSLLELPTQNTLVKIEDLALPFAKNISEHLLLNDKQVTASSSTFLDHCRKFNNQEIGENVRLKCRRRFGSTLALPVQVRQRRQTPADRQKGARGFSARSRKARNRRAPQQHSRLPQLDDCAG